MYNFKRIWTDVILILVVPIYTGFMKLWHLCLIVCMVMTKSVDGVFFSIDDVI